MNQSFHLTHIGAACMLALSATALAQQEAVPSTSSAGASAQEERQVEATLPTVTVVGTRDIALRADHAPATTKGTTPLIKTPMSVQVIPRALIEDRQANILREALQTISGVFAGATSLHEDIIVRGFYVDQSYRNGVRTRRFGPTELANAERIDVLKGPSSTQFGRGDVSGMFNVVTKKPEADAGYAIEQQIGSDSFYQTTVDATGPINSDRTLRYRLIGSYENAGSFRDLVETRRTFIAPSFSWMPSDATRINLEIEVARHNSPIDRGIPAFGDRPAEVPRGRNYSESNAFHVNDSNLVALDWSHKIDATWTLRQNFMLERGRGHGLEYQQGRAMDIADLGITDPTVLVRLPRHIERRDVKTEYTSLELAGTPVWGGMKHDLVTGVDVARLRQNFDFREDMANDVEFLPIFDFTPTGAQPLTAAQGTLRETSATSWGAYVQDQVQLNEQFNLMLGGRYDNAKEKGMDLTDPTPDGRTDTHDKKFSPRVGLTYSWTPHTSWYGSYTESFSQANSDKNADGSAMKPIAATQYELGFKAESTDKRVFTTLSLYNLTKENIVVPDGFNNSRQVGEAQSRGLEWDLGGRVTPHWNLTASYSYTHAKVTRDAKAENVGKRLYGVPLNSAKAFARYDEIAGGATGWSIGGGFVALGSQAGDVENSFKIAGYVRLDGMAAYKWRVDGKRMTAQFNIENLGDKTYHLPTGGAGEIAFGKPRTLMASLRAEF